MSVATLYNIATHYLAVLLSILIYFLIKQEYVARWPAARAVSLPVKDCVESGSTFVFHLPSVGAVL